MSVDLHGPWEWWWLLGLIPGIVFWGLIITLLVMVVRRRPPPRREPSDALRVLEERFARGEIGADEFRAMRSTLLDEGS